MVACPVDGPGPPLCPDCDLLAGPFMTAAGMAALLTPGWVADAAGFPRHTHFVHDAGASSSASASPCCWQWPGATGSP
jgi:hypothetical protein